jgi:AmpE protein
MKLLILLVVLGVRRLDRAWPEWLRSPARFARLLLPCEDLADRLRLSGLPRWLVMIALPVVAIGVLIGWLHCLLGGVPGWILGGALLLWLLGPESESRRVDDLLVRGRMRDEAGVAELAEEFAVTGDPGQSGYFTNLYRQILQREATGLFAVSFWLIVLGYWAALLYALNWFVLRVEERDHALAETARVVHSALFWIPARLLVACMALAGDWRRVSEAMSGRIWQLDEDDALVEDAMNAAVDQTDQEEPRSMEEAMDRLESRQGLLLRCLAIWLLLAAAWVLIV